MRPYTSRMKPPFTMIGSSVAEVEESKHPNFPVGATIVIMAGRLEQESADRLVWDARQHGLLRPPRDLQAQGRRDCRRLRRCRGGWQPRRADRQDQGLQRRRLCRVRREVQLVEEHWLRPRVQLQEDRCYREPC